MTADAAASSCTVGGHRPPLQRKNVAILLVSCSYFSSVSEPVAKLSISGSVPESSSSSGPKIWPVNLSLKAFFPPSGLNLGERLRPAWRRDRNSCGDDRLEMPQPRPDLRNLGW